MGFNRQNYIKIKSEYDGKYLRAEEAARLRRAEVHARLPEVKAIDERLSTSGIRIFEASVCGDRALVDAISHENMELLQQRAVMLRTAGYPEDYTEIKYECSLCF